MLCDYRKSTNLNAAAPPALTLIPALFRSTSVKMKDETQVRRWSSSWALPASLIMHAFIIALLVNSLPRPSQQPQEEQAVHVALVPAPDQPKPKPAPAPPPKDSKTEKAPEPKVEKPPPPEKQSPKSASIEVLKPVFQFGDKNAGPKNSLDGGSAQDNSPSPAKDTDPNPPVVAKNPANKSDRVVGPRGGARRCG